MGLERTETPQGELRSNQSWNELYLNQNQMTRITLHWLRHAVQCIRSMYEYLSMLCAHNYWCFWIKKTTVCWFFPQGWRKELKLFYDWHLPLKTNNRNSVIIIINYMCTHVRMYIPPLDSLRQEWNPPNLWVRLICDTLPWNASMKLNSN